MSNKRYTEKEIKKKFKNIKYSEIQGATNYIIFENRKIWSRRSGMLITTYYVNGRELVELIYDDRHSGSTTVEHLIRKNLLSIPEIEGVQHRPLKGYENAYQIYSNGSIWSKRFCYFLTVCKTKQKYDLVCLLDDVKNKKTAYIYRLVYQNFVGEIPEGYEIHHISGNHQDNSINNLQLVTKSKHRQYHNEMKRGVPRNKIKEMTYTVIGE